MRRIMAIIKLNALAPGHRSEAWEATHRGEWIGHLLHTRRGWEVVLDGGSGNVHAFGTVMEALDLLAELRGFNGWAVSCDPDTLKVILDDAAKAEDT